MEIIRTILGNTSLWEITLLLTVVYLMLKPEILRSITKLKIGDIEVELSSLKKEVQKGKDKINELEFEMKNDRKILDDLQKSFDASAPIEDLKHVRKQIKSHAKNLSDANSLKDYLSMQSSAEELYVAAVSIKESKPVALLPELISFLGDIASSNTIGGYRFNTIWTLTSGLHGILISCIRDGVEPKPNKELLISAKEVLEKLGANPKVLEDRPDKPEKGIRGPIKDCMAWINKGLEEARK